MFKKYFSILLCMTMLLSAISVSLGSVAFALGDATVIDSGECGDDATWTLYSDGEIVIDGTGKMWLSNGNSSFNDNWDSVKSVTIKAGITSIGNEEFFASMALTAINVDSGNKNYSSVDGVLFTKDKTILIQYPTGKTDESYSIPGGVTSIGDHAFYSCTFLTSITGSSSLVSIGYSAFENCTSLTSISIQDGLVSIAYSAFENCTSLTSISIPNSLTYIGTSAFRNCTSLTSINIPDGVTEIDWGAFFNCSSLTSINIPSNVVSIGYSVFSSCKSLTAINVDNKNKNYCSVGGVLFNIDKVELIQYPAGKTNKSYSIPDGVVSIASFAFSGCASLTSVSIPSGAESIGCSAFENCTSLTSINIPDSVTNIDSFAFLNCTSLTSINIPDGVSYISISAFSNCTSLMSINIPDSITFIDSYAFENCTSLVTINIPKNISYIGEYPFKNCTALAAFNVDSGNKKYSSVDGVLFNKAKTELIQYPPGKPGESYFVPDGTTFIGDCAFSYCTALTSINIPDSVCAIDVVSAFYNCKSLTAINVGAENESYCSVDGVLFNKTKIGLCLYPMGKQDEAYSVPDGVEFIGDNAFFGCKSLTSISLPDSLISISAFAFSNCTALKAISLPDRVQIIFNNAFENCTSLRYIRIPNSVTCTALSLFEGCDNLTIYGYSGSVAENYAKENGIPFEAIGDWARISIDEANKNVIINSKEISLEDFYGVFKTESLSVKDKDGKEIDKENGVIGTGSTVTVLDSEGKASGGAYTVIVMGDVNGDGFIKTNDARLALRAAVNIEPLNDAFLAASKVRESEKVTTFDACKILRVAVNIDAKF